MNITEYRDIRIFIPNYNGIPLTYKALINLNYRTTLYRLNTNIIDKSHSPNIFCKKFQK